ncbi:hypothetical protein M153_2910002986 [Pseudoloma neurophilia]|uniref:Uncharacterized protein n=1 Tax=Pseudoloma neurophilia TaxID=146866 RepID=A0A0R0M5L0_9MICR|nr:hypothetical protein M153_2910002986 [Pseudoloma neurophilia]
MVILVELLREIENTVTESFDMLKTKNISKLNDFLNQIFVVIGKCPNKKELGAITKTLIELFQKAQKVYFMSIDSTDENTEEIQIEISENEKKFNHKQIENLLRICNRIMEIFLGIIKFSERFESCLTAKGMSINKEQVFFLNVYHNIKKETALEICNSSLNFFERQRKLVLFIQNFDEKIKKSVCQDSLIFSFLLVTSISSNVNHTHSIGVEEVFFFFINYIMNRNSELDEFFIKHFSKQYYNLNSKERSGANNSVVDSLSVRGCEVLQIGNLDFRSFFKNQLIRQNKVDLLREIILEQNSHSFIEEIGQFLIYKIFYHHEIAQTFIDTFKNENFSSTTSILTQMFTFDHGSTESLLKELIIVKNAIMYRDMFFEKCKRLDSAYIDCLSVLSFQVAFLSFEMVGKILKSHYLVFLVQDMDLFHKFLEKFSEYHFHMSLNDQKFDEDKFYIHLIDKMLIQKHNSQLNVANILPKKMTEQWKTDSVESFSSNLSAIAKHSPLESTLESMQKSIMFLDFFPTAIEYILPFLKILLARFCSKSERKDKNAFNDSASEDLFLQNSLMINTNTASEIFAIKNTEVITRILNLTRPYVLNWNLQNLLRKLNPILLMKNHIFLEPLKLDSLLFNALNEVLYHITENNKIDQMTEMKTQNQEYVHVLIYELNNIFKSDDVFRTFILTKHFDFSRLLQIADFNDIIDINPNFHCEFIHEQNNFYNQAPPDGTFPSFSQTTNRTVLQNKPLDNNLKINNTVDLQKTFVESLSNLSENSVGSSFEEMNSKHRQIQTYGFLNQNNHMTLSEIDESFSVVSLISRQNDNKSTKSYTNQHLFIDLMTDLMKLDFLKRNENFKLQHELVDFCRSRLLLNYSFKPGLAFYSSRITFETKKRNFCLFCNFFQYQSDGTQYIIKFHLELGFLGIRILNKTLQLINHIESNEKIIYQETLSNNRINTAFELHSKILSCDLNDERLRISTNKIKQIEIGDGFRGIVDKILFFEDEKFDHKYRKILQPEEFYDSCIQALEKRCSFYNNFGFIMFKDTPFYFSSKRRNIEIQNVFPIEQFDFERAKIES